MSRILALCLLLLAGCSTSPIANTLDRFFPGRLPSGNGPYTGGVGGIAPPSSVPGSGEIPPPIAPPDSGGGLITTPKISIPQP